MIKDIFPNDDLSKNVINPICIGCGTCAPGECLCCLEKEEKIMNKNVCKTCGEVYSGKKCPTCEPETQKKDEK